MLKIAMQVEICVAGFSKSEDHFAMPTPGRSNTVHKQIL